MTRFFYLSAATALGIFAIIILGGVVRVSESGLGCPDWPLCHGQLTPPLEAAALIEYSHRLLVTLVGILALATAVVAWIAYRRRRWIVAPATITLALIVGQAVLGGATVQTDLEAPLVVAHLGLAQLVLISAVVTTVAAWWLKADAQSNLRAGIAYEGRQLQWVFAAAASIYATMLVGSYIAAHGAGLACPQLPLCSGGAQTEDGRFVLAHMVHRSLALATAVLVVAALVQAWRSRQLWLRRVMSLAIVSVLMQILLGVVAIWLKAPEAIVVAHLGNGAFLWALLATAPLLLIARGQLAALSWESAPADLVRRTR